LLTSNDVLNELRAVGLLPEDQRIKRVAMVRQPAVRTPDAGFLNRDTVSFLTTTEIKEILGDVRENCCRLHTLRAAAAPTNPAMNFRPRIHHLISCIVDSLSWSRLHVWP
jgi:hypothetical protein